jgi:hypothetical protein
MSKFVAEQIRGNRLLFAPTQSRLRAVAIEMTSQGSQPANKIMSDAQVGLMTATPIIIVFALALRRMGVLSSTATVSAVGLSVAIAMVLFTTQ